MPADSDGGRTASILAVCTGNICRSPYAARVLGHALPPDAVEVTSAGTGALVGEDLDPEAKRLLRARGVDDSGHQARQLTWQDVRAADLVLAMTTEHRAAAVRLFPRAARTTFTAREVARLLPAADLEPLPGDAAGRVRALPAALAAARGQRARGSSSDDVGDPFGRGQRAFGVMADELDPALAALVAAVQGDAH